MCNNIVILYLFMILKLLIIIILPIIIFIKRKNKISRKLLIIDIILLLIVFIGNIFSSSSCLYNSNPNGIKKMQKKKLIELSNNIHSNINNDYIEENVNPKEYYKTFIGTNFYYYNQNDSLIAKEPISCAEDYYMNKYGAPITTVSMTMSTLLNRNVSPIEILNLYLSNTTDCSNGINIEDIFRLIVDNYVGIEVRNISDNEIFNEIRNGGIVIAKVEGSSNSKISCGESYIVIYNMTLEGKLIIADPDDRDYPYICSKSSNSYGSVLSNNKTNSEWSLEDLNNDVTKYYLIKRL